MSVGRELLEDGGEWLHEGRKEGTPKLGDESGRGVNIPVRGLKVSCAVQETEMMIRKRYKR